MFVLKQLVLNLSDSLAEKDPILWSDIYISGLCKAFKLPFRKNTAINFNLYSVRTDIEVDQKITSELNEVAMNIIRKYIIDRPLEQITFVVHGTSGDKSFTDTVFNQTFGKEESFGPLEWSKRWRGRIVFVNPLCILQMIV